MALTKAEREAVNEAQRAFAQAKKLLEDACLRISTMRTVSTPSAIIERAGELTSDARYDMARFEKRLHAYLEDP